MRVQPDGALRLMTLSCAARRTSKSTTCNACQYRNREFGSQRDVASTDVPRKSRVEVSPPGDGSRSDDADGAQI